MIDPVLSPRKRRKTNFWATFQKGKKTTKFIQRVLGLFSNRFRQEDERHL